MLDWKSKYEAYKKKHPSKPSPSSSSSNSWDALIVPALFDQFFQTIDDYSCASICLCSPDLLAVCHLPLLVCYHDVDEISSSLKLA
ncbi:hypothetical protein ACL02P_10855 [Paenibacillus sp. MB22_1]|uniref:hypothetical protein n=1 Tax=Paenibacillus sp. MB22_1 TaxID=3383121 RepID=UPI0039A13FB7